jgi:hypothetical protein
MVRRLESEGNAKSERWNGQGRVEVEVRMFDGVAGKVASEELDSEV